MPRFQAALLFDDACPLCNGAVRFVLARDGGRVGLLALNSEVGQQVARRLGLDPANPTSFALIQADGAQFGAHGVLNTLALLPGWGWVRHLPAAPFEPLYRLIARNRYRLTKGLTCPIPTPAQQARLIQNLSQLPELK